MDKLAIIIVVLMLGNGYYKQCNEKTAAKESNLEIATKYYIAEDYKEALPYYKKVIYKDKAMNNGSTFYRFAYSWEQVEPNMKESFAPFYSISAYILERDNDTKNKYYSYAINKEKKFGVTHDGFNNELINQMLTLPLNKNLLICLWAAIAIATIFLLAILIRFFSTSKERKPKWHGFKRDLKELFDTKYYKYYSQHMDEHFKRLEKLQELYVPMLQMAKNEHNISYENFLLYKFCQVIFTRDASKKKISPNAVDYKTVDKGLNAFFPVEVENTVTLEAYQKRINFINKAYAFFSAWHKLQEKYNYILFEIPEWGALATTLVLRTKDTVLLEKVNNICDNYEDASCFGYRKRFMLVANMIYHNTFSSGDAISEILKTEMFDRMTNKRFAFRKAFMKMQNFLIHILPIYFFSYVYSVIFALFGNGNSFNNALIASVFAVAAIPLKRIISGDINFISISESEQIAKANKEPQTEQFYDSSSLHSYENDTDYYEYEQPEDSFDNFDDDYEQQIRREKDEERERRNQEDRERQNAERQRRQEDQERRAAERKKIITISDIQQKGRWYAIFDETGKKIKEIPVSKGNLLGFSSSFFILVSGRWYATYDGNCNKIKDIPVQKGEFQSIAGDTFILQHGRWLTTYRSDGTKVAERPA